MLITHLSSVKSAFYLLSQSGARVSFSQFGEDVIAFLVLQEHYRIDKRLYVDVGADDPWRFSSTAALHKVKGWRAIKVDACEDSIASFAR